MFIAVLPLSCYTSTSTSLHHFRFGFDSVAHIHVHPYVIFCGFFAIVCSICVQCTYFAHFSKTLSFCWSSTKKDCLTKQFTMCERISLLGIHAQLSVLITISFNLSYTFVIRESQNQDVTFANYKIVFCYALTCCEFKLNQIKLTK